MNIKVNKLALFKIAKNAPGKYVLRYTKLYLFGMLENQ